MAYLVTLKPYLRLLGLWCSRQSKADAHAPGLLDCRHPVAKLVSSGLELGEADDQVFGTQGSKQHNGAVGLLTHDVLTRDGFYAQAVQLALIPFINPQLYPKRLR